MADRIKCPQCEGTGEIDLFTELQRALDTVRLLNGATASDVYDCGRYTRIGVTAINNHLEALRKLGLVTRERRGRQYVYTAVNPAPEVR